MFDMILRNKLRKIKYDTELVIRIEEYDKIYDYIFGEHEELYFEYPLVVIYDLNMIELERIELAVLKKENNEDHMYKIVEELDKLIKNQKD